MKLTDLAKQLGKPATRALAAQKIEDLHVLCQYTRQQIVDLHGVGPKAIKVLEAEMTQQKIVFKAEAVQVKPGITSIDEYILQFDAPTQNKLNQMRQIIRAAAPDATEKISYQMPTFYLNGNLVHFAAYVNHIGFYPAPSAIREFQQELAVYKNAKGSVQFPLDQALPVDLILQMVAFRAAENRSKSKLKNKL